MSRKPVDWVKITGRISTDLSSQEDYAYAVKKLSKMDQSDFIRQCVNTQRLFDSGQLISKEMIEPFIDVIVNKVLDSVQRTIQTTATFEEPLRLNELSAVKDIPSPPVISRIPDSPIKEDLKPKNPEINNFDSNMTDEIAQKVEEKVSKSGILGKLQAQLKDGAVGSNVRKK